MLLSIPRDSTSLSDFLTSFGTTMSSLTISGERSRSSAGACERETRPAVLRDSPSYEFPLKSARETRFAAGGHVFAAASGQVITVYNALLCERICELRSHNAPVWSIHWSPDDEYLFSAGKVTAARANAARDAH